MTRIVSLFIFVLLSAMAFSSVEAEMPESGKVNQEQNDSSVIQAFNSGEVKKSKTVAIEDETKQLVMFLMGIPLLIMLATTVALGVAMVIYGKKVFVAHMICAGLSMTLAIAHAVVGIVWFNPF